MVAGAGPACGMFWQPAAASANAQRQQRRAIHDCIQHRCGHVERDAAVFSAAARMARVRISATEASRCTNSKPTWPPIPRSFRIAAAAHLGSLRCARPPVRTGGRTDARVPVRRAEAGERTRAGLDARGRHGGARRRHRQLRRPLRRRASRTAVPDAGFAPRHRARRRQVRRHAGRDHRHRMRERAECHAGRACRSRSRSLGFGDEEGVRFGSTLLGSRAVAGTFDLAVLDNDGRERHDDARRAARLRPRSRADRARSRASPADVLAYAELHIEQGPVLEAEGLATGVVTAINGGNRFSIELTGMAGHAGTVPMGLRRDALAAASECVLAIERIAASMPDSRRHRGPHRGAARSDERHSGQGPVFARRARADRRPAARGRRGDPRRLRGDRARAATSPWRPRRCGKRRRRRAMPDLQRQFAAAIDEGGRARASPAFGRGPRRHGAHRHRADRHAVRPLQGRDQPQSGGSGHARRCRRRRARLRALHRVVHAAARLHGGLP